MRRTGLMTSILHLSPERGGRSLRKVVGSTSLACGGGIDGPVRGDSRRSGRLSKLGTKRTAVGGAGVNQLKRQTVLFVILILGGALACSTPPATVSSTPGEPDAPEARTVPEPSYSLSTEHTARTRPTRLWPAKLIWSAS